MDTVKIDRKEYVKSFHSNDCQECVGYRDPELCEALPDNCLEQSIVWVRKAELQKTAEMNAFFGRPLTTQMDLFPETLAVTREEEEDWQAMQKKVATGVTDGTQYHRQVGGDHYFNPIQPWDIIRAWELNYWEGNIVKYVLRHKGKNKVEDLEKARHYLDYLIENYDELYQVSN